MLTLRSCFVVAATLLCGLFAPLLAQSAATGSIAGRVLNPATQEYVRNAQITLQQTGQATTSEGGGNFRFHNVPAGEVTLVVRFAGYADATLPVQVTAGATVRPEISLGAPGTATTTTSEDGTVHLDQFVVSSEREGNAKAIMNQRNSMNVSRTVASDIFGDVTEGNVGEFLKFLPGVELEYVEADTRGPRLGGMDPQYAGVTIDGMKLASADAFMQYGSSENGSTGSGARSFGFEQVSINSIESIEINRVVSADMDADAPAGTINLRTKRAFDLRGRRIGWNVSTVLNSEEFHLDKSVGPNDGTGRKFKPNYSFNFSDTFFNNRLGILIGVSESNLYNEQYRIDHTYNRTPTATDARPQVLTALAFKDGPKWTERFSTTFTADFKATEDLVLSLSTLFNGYDARFYNRTVTLQAATNNTNATTGRQFAGGDGITSFGTTSDGAAGGRTVAIGGGNGIKLTNTFTIVPKFEFTRGPLVLDGAFSYSRARNDYDNLVRGTAGNATVNSIQNVGFTATRSEAHEAEWQVTQTSGADWADIGSYTNPRLTDDGRWAKNEIYTGELNARFELPLALPTFIKVGGKYREALYLSRRTTAMLNWSYIGPGGNVLNPDGSLTTTGTYAGYQSPFIFDMGQTGARFTSVSGGGAPVFANRDELAGLLKSNPEYFVQSFTPENFYTAMYGDRRDYQEDIAGAYVMANTKVGRWTFQGGVRFENTETISTEFDPRPASEVVAAGYTVNTTGNAAGRANTVPGLIYQFESRPRVERRGEYRNYFPNLTAKWNVADNFIADFGVGKAIKRPEYNDVTGIWEINEIAETVELPNPNLRPELSEKVVGALGYYFAGSGYLTLTLSHTKIKNLHRETDQTAEEFGNTDPALDSYTFTTVTSDGAPVTFRAMEWAYSQPLTFLPSVLKGTSLFATYTRTYATERRPGLTPHTATAGISYRYKRASVSLNGVWQDEAPWTNTVGRYRHENTKYDLGVTYAITPHLSVFASGRNISQAPHRIYEERDGNERVLWRLENYGSNWTFGVRGTF